MSIRTGTLAALAAASIVAVMIPNAAAAADRCDELMATSRSMQADLTSALDAMNKKDTARMRALLPGLERRLNALPAAEILPETCADHANAYTALQYTQLTTLQARGQPTGFPAKLTIVKQPDLNHRLLAYAVGWIKYETGDLDGAKAAYAKGLKMYPHDPSLQSEYMATLIKMSDGAGVVAFAAKVLADTPNLTDSERANTYRALGIGYVLQNDRANGKSMLEVAQKYERNQDTDTILKQLDGGS